MGFLWPLVTRTTLDEVLTINHQLKLDILVVGADAKAARERGDAKTLDLIDAKHTIQDLRMQLVEANGELMDMKLRRAL